MFEGNAYHAASPSARHWEWHGHRTWNEFVDGGQEATGKLVAELPSPEALGIPPAVR
jgi:hypothetical protein